MEIPLEFDDKCYTYIYKMNNMMSCKSFRRNVHTFRVRVIGDQCGCSDEKLRNINMTISIEIIKFFTMR